MLQQMFITIPIFIVKNVEINKKSVDSIVHLLYSCIPYSTSIIRQKKELITPNFLTI